MTLRMLNRVCLVLCLSLGAGQAMAKGDSWCHGYIKKALGEFPVEGFNRNDLWLAWNETVKQTIIADNLSEDAYQAGRDTFQQQLEANDVAAMNETSDDECDFGRNSTWVWW
jgi:hypothetical protein